MPPRRRRSGYKPGELSQQMRDAIAADAAQLDDIDDDVETIKAVGQWFNGLDDAILQIGEPRLRAIANLRALGWSYNKLVEETGLSKTRVAYLVHQARRRGL